MQRFVGVRGIGPPTSRSQTERSTDELHSENLILKSAAGESRTLTPVKEQGLLRPPCIPFHHRGALDYELTYLQFYLTLKI